MPPTRPSDDFFDDEGFETDQLPASPGVPRGRDPGLQRHVRHELRHLLGAFQNYYKDLSQRLKNREIDLVIVVNMFLTGFDATTLNTLWVDKNLRAHGLIQAYSRTNRILNSVKTFGNIVSFRDLEEETNDAIALFGNKDARGIVLLKPYADYYGSMPRRSASCSRHTLWGRPIVGEAAQKAFIALFGSILRLRNILTSFDDFAGNEILTTAAGAGLHERLSRPLCRVPQGHGRREGVHRRRRGLRDRTHQAGRDQRRLHPHARREVPQAKGDGEDKEIRAAITGPSTPARRCATRRTSSRSSSTPCRPAKRAEELDRIITDEGLNPDATRSFVDAAFRDGAVQPTGTAITTILPPVSRFGQDGAHAAKKVAVLAKLSAFFDRFFGLS
jgi:type I restriction enzyme R subunit